jgi:anti-sigma factor RsiW
MAARDDIELMQHADGELDRRHTSAVEARIVREPDAATKIESLGQIRELVRSHLEIAADDVPDRKFEAMWRKIDRSIEASAASEEATGLWGTITNWLDRHRGHVITGAISAGAVAALALILRPGDHREAARAQTHAIDVQPAALRAAPEIESLDTPDGTGTVLNIEDEDGHTTVIWVSPADTVEGI